MKNKHAKVTLTAIAVCFAFSTAFAANLPKNCTDEIISLSKGSSFDMQKFMKDLPAAVVKAKAQAKLPFGKPKDSEKTSIGMTFGCLKAFPESPSQIMSLLKDVSLKIGKGSAAKMADEEYDYEDEEYDDEDYEDEEVAKPASSSAGPAKPAVRLDTVRVAVVETEVDAELPALAKEFKPSELSYITKEIRRTATNNLPKTRVFIMTESVRAQGDIISIGEKTGADFVVKGTVSKFRKNYTFSVEVYDAGNGALLTSSNPVGNEKVEDMLSNFYEIAPDFFKRFEDEVKRIEDGLNSSRKIASAPTASKKSKAPVVVPPVYIREDGTFVDSRNNKVYKTVKMPDGKFWMAENMNYATKTSACYQNNASICQKCGRLYDWEIAMKVCPAGWHLPSDAEWTALEKAIGGYSKAGAILKAKSGWDNNGNGTDKYNFSAFACGYGYLGGSSFGYFGLSANFWSASENDSRTLFASDADMSKNSSDRSDMLSVRCVKN
ncbi:MAG: fibrobacter succinogenes major paralogous domain-containing protein [Fibromonadaceae bacterium]|jgi:uncharacterized protein (TIGR02145 family)|nr:fibrobacter succinogenes major paralogous domain-containing protein [Fibromonadaceae bacterium]